MGFVTIGIFTVSVQGVEGALFQMLSHGIISAALFLCVGVVYDRIHSRDIARYGGLVHRMPAYALVFMVFTLGALGLPGTSGFIGEFLSLLAAYQTNRLLAVLASIGVVLGAVYMLWLYRRVMLGVLEKEELKSILDLNRREVAIFTPLVVLVLWMGIYPEYFLGFMHVSANNLVENFEIARGLQLAVATP
jgi:NADH-quinone oxidoreductase subunit M